MVAKLLRCSFCNKSQNDVRKLIAGPAVFICDECVGVCQDIIDEDGNAGCSFCGKSEGAVSKLVTGAYRPLARICDGCLRREHANIDDDVKSQGRELVAALLSAVVQERPGIRHQHSAEWSCYYIVCPRGHTRQCDRYPPVAKWAWTPRGQRVFLVKTNVAALFGKWSSEMLFEVHKGGPFPYRVSFAHDGRSTKVDLLLKCRQMLSCPCGGLDFQIKVQMNSDPPLAADDPLVWPKLIDAVKAVSGPAPNPEIGAALDDSITSPAPQPNTAATSDAFRIDEHRGRVDVNNESYRLSTFQIAAVKKLKDGGRLHRSHFGDSGPYKIFRSADGRRFYKNFVRNDNHGEYWLALS